MKYFCCAVIVAACYACATGQADTKASDLALDSLAAAGADTVTYTGIGQEPDAADSLNEAEIEESAGHDDGIVPPAAELIGTLSADGVYTMTNLGMYAFNPFGFSLDTTSLRELLPDAVFKYTETPAGKDEDGEVYGEYTYFEVESGRTTLSFYSYSGKHHADIYTPALTMKGPVNVGMTKQDFIDRMNLYGNDPYYAKVFTVNDDYGSVSFYFNGNILERIYVNYEEGD